MRKRRQRRDPGRGEEVGEEGEEGSSGATVEGMRESASGRAASGEGGRGGRRGEAAEREGWHRHPLRPPLLFPREASSASPERLSHEEREREEKGGRERRGRGRGDYVWSEWKRGNQQTGGWRGSRGCVEEERER
eukprot:scaffold40161_cov29-Tisochrysis_lutea.AAC.4